MSISTPKPRLAALYFLITFAMLAALVVPVSAAPTASSSTNAGLTVVAPSNSTASASLNPPSAAKPIAPTSYGSKSAATAPNVGCIGTVYADVCDNYWSLPYIITTSQATLITGTRDINNAMTGYYEQLSGADRASFAVAFVHQMGISAPITPQLALDVPPSHWAYNEIQAVIYNGIMTTTGGLFHPYTPMLRQEVAHTISVAHNLPSPDCAVDTCPFFGDLTIGTQVYSDALTLWYSGLETGFLDNNIFQLCDDPLAPHHFYPTEVEQRQQLAVLFSGFVNTRACPPSMVHDPVNYSLAVYRKGMWHIPFDINASDGPVNLGALVVNQGDAAMTNVQIGFYINNITDTNKVFTKTLAYIPAHGEARAVAPAAFNPNNVRGVRSIFAKIEAADQPYSNHSNDVTSIDVPVLPNQPDNLSPDAHVIINSSEQVTNVPTVTLTLSSTDDSGIVSGVFVQESDRSSSGWTPHLGKWYPYNTTMPFVLQDLTPGAKSIQVWFSDAYGNVSNSASATINFIPDQAYIPANGWHIFIFDYPVGTYITCTLTTAAGDSDMFLWLSDDVGSPNYVSNNYGTTEDNFIYPADGNPFQLQVEGYALSAYHLTIDVVGGKQAVARRPSGNTKLVPDLQMLGKSFSDRQVLPPPPAPHFVSPTSPDFDDVPLGFWAYDYVEQSFSYGITSGTAPRTYAPSANVTRAQITKLVVLSNGWDISAPMTQTFTDVPPNYFAYPYIETAVANGIVSGYTAQQCGDNGATFPCFLPNTNITRAQTTKVVVLGKGWQIGGSRRPTQTFDDVPPNYWAYGYIEAAVQHGIVNGIDPTHFAPALNSRRDQISKLVVLSINQP